jgi:hypothetical protein
MDASIHDYTEQNVPELHLTKPIRHPNNATDIIGHTGVDKVAAGAPRVATFPRRKDEHWFRGDSTSGLTGYGISEDVLDQLRHRPNRPPVKWVVIVETDNSRVIEYDFVGFKDATLVSYAPQKNECIIGEEPLQVDDDLYHDRQRVLPVDQARRTFDREEVTILQ